MSTNDRLQPLVINTDGSAFRNGTKDAVAGVGVYFVCRDIKNIGVPLGKGKQTNQRAELMAILLALEGAPADRDVLIRSDSKYAINCVTDWAYKWAHRSWRKPAGVVMENMDIIEPILERDKTRRMLNASTKYKWVKGHAGDRGNEGADRLAKQGSKRAFNARRRAKAAATTRENERSPPPPTRDRDEDKDTDKVEAASTESDNTPQGQNDTVTTEPARSTKTGDDDEEASRQEGNPAKDSTDAERVRIASPDRLPCSEAVLDSVVGAED